MTWKVECELCPSVGEYDSVEEANYGALAHLSDGHWPLIEKHADGYTIDCEACSSKAPSECDPDEDANEVATDHMAARHWPAIYETDDDFDEDDEDDE